MDPTHIEILGFLAGALNLSSSVPQLLANLRDPELARSQSLQRNIFQCAGNLAWLVYGLLMGSTAMITFAGLGCMMASGLAVQTALSRGRPTNLVAHA